MVVGVASGQDRFAAEAAEDAFEAFRGCDAADGAGFAAAEEFEGLLVFRMVDVLEDDWPVAAGNDFGGAVEASDAVADFVVAIRAVAFGQEDVTGAAEVAGRFAKRAAGEEEFVAEGGIAVDEHDVEAAAEPEVLEAVVEQEGIASEFAHGPASGFDSVLVDDHGDAGEVAGEHPWFIACVGGVACEVGAIADDERGHFCFAAGELLEESGAQGRFDAFVAPAEDGDAAAFLAEAPGEHFDDGSFAGAADGEVADADDGGSEVVIGFDAVAEEGEAALHEAMEDAGESMEEEAQSTCAHTAALAEDDFHAPLFETVEVFARHGVRVKSGEDAETVVVGGDRADFRGGGAMPCGEHGAGDGWGGVLEGEAADRGT